MLIRDGKEGQGPELLLLKRQMRTRFAPGAWVFPGGRVDAEDDDPRLQSLWSGISPRAAARRLRLSSEDRPSGLAYFTAALREAFEETGILLWRGDQPLRRAALDQARESLMRGDASALAALLEDGGARLDGSRIAYIGHWVTPLAEPRRYDARFFAVRIQAGDRARYDMREMSDSAWLSPENALQKHQEGTLPMIFPTIRTIESLRGHRSADALLASLRQRPVQRRRPEIAKTADGVRVIQAESE